MVEETGLGCFYKNTEEDLCSVNLAGENGYKIWPAHSAVIHWVEWSSICSGCKITNSSQQKKGTSFFAGFFCWNWWKNMEAEPWNLRQPKHSGTELQRVLSMRRNIQWRRKQRMPHTNSRFALKSWSKPICCEWYHQATTNSQRLVDCLMQINIFAGSRVLHIYFCSSFNNKLRSEKGYLHIWEAMRPEAKQKLPIKIPTSPSESFTCTKGEPGCWQLISKRRPRSF